MKEMQARLIVDAGHPAIRIEVLDAQYQVCARGYGHVDETLLTGLYIVRYLAADARHERYITLLPGEPVELRDAPPLRFSSAAPLPQTSTDRAGHLAQAQRLSLAAPASFGEGAQVFLFVRDLVPGGTGHLTRGLMIRTAEGNLIGSLDDIAETSGPDDETAWAGRTIALDPGVYQLLGNAPGEPGICTTLVACPGWQTQYFLLRHPEPDGESPWLGMLDAGQFMARIGQGFVPHDGFRRLDLGGAGDDYQLADLARQALAHRRRMMGDDDLYDLLAGQPDNPLLGILVLHLLLLRPEPQLDVADKVVNHLRQIVSGFRHPDLEALAAHIHLLRGLPVDIPPVESPPMFRRSWEMLVNATVSQPSVIVRGSLAARISDQLVGSGAWLVWAAQAATYEAPDVYLTGGRADSEPVPPLDPGSHLSIAEWGDRVVIGGVTVFKRGADRYWEGARLDYEPEWYGGDPLFALARPATSDAFPYPIVSVVRDADERQQRDRAVAEAIVAFRDDPESAQAQLATVDYTALRTIVEALLPEIDEWLTAFGPWELAEALDLDPVETALLLQAEAIRHPAGNANPEPPHDPLALRIVGKRPDGYLFRQPTRTLPHDPLALDVLVRQLGLPADRVRQAMSGLFLALSTLVS